MSDEAVPAPPAAPERAAVFGMSCAMVSVLALLNAADYIFMRMARFVDVYKSVNVRISWLAQFIYEYGWVLWLAVAAGTVVSIHQAVRHGGRPRTVALNVTVLITAVVFSALIRHSAWDPLWSLLEGIGPVK